MKGKLALFFCAILTSIALFASPVKAKAETVPKLSGVSIKETVYLGENFKLSGYVSGNGGTVYKVHVNTWLLSNKDINYIPYSKEGLNVSSFNLSNIGSFTVGKDIFKQEGVYRFQIHARNVGNSGGTTLVDMDITVKKAPIPIMKNFSVSKTVTMGDTFDLSGTIDGDGGTLFAVHMNTWLLSNNKINNEFRKEDLEVSSFKLSKFGTLTVGEDIFKQEGVYRFQIHARNVGNSGGTTLVNMDITVKAAPKPTLGDFMIVCPADDVTVSSDADLILSWTDSDNANYYLYTVSDWTSKPYTYVIKSVKTKNTYATVPRGTLKAGHKYKIFVKACYDEDTDLVEEALITAIAPPNPITPIPEITITTAPKPTLGDFMIVCPADDVTVSSDADLVLSWTSSDNANYYLYSVKDSTNTTYTEVITSIKTTNTYATVPRGTLKAGRKYTIYVKACYDEDTTLFKEVRITAIAPPAPITTAPITTAPITTTPITPAPITTAPQQNAVPVMPFSTIEDTVNMGEAFVTYGLISANGGTLQKIQIEAFLLEDSSCYTTLYSKENLNLDYFDLSKIGDYVVGENAFKKAGTYLLQIRAKNVGNNYDTLLLEKYITVKGAPITEKPITITPEPITPKPVTVPPAPTKTPTPKLSKQSIKKTVTMGENFKLSGTISANEGKLQKVQIYAWLKNNKTYSYELYNKNSINAASFDLSKVNSFVVGKDIFQKAGTYCLQIDAQNKGNSGVTTVLQMEITVKEAPVTEKPITPKPVTIPPEPTKITPKPITEKPEPKVGDFRIILPAEDGVVSDGANLSMYWTEADNANYYEYAIMEKGSSDWLVEPSKVYETEAVVSRGTLEANHEYTLCVVAYYDKDTFTSDSVSFSVQKAASGNTTTITTVPQQGGTKQYLGMFYIEPFGRKGVACDKDLSVSWTKPENANYYCVSLKNLSTGKMLLQSVYVGVSLEYKIPKKYLKENTNYSFIVTAYATGYYESSQEIAFTTGQHEVTLPEKTAPLRSNGVIEFSNSKGQKYRNNTVQLYWESDFSSNELAQVSYTVVQAFQKNTANSGTAVAEQRLDGAATTCRFNKLYGGTYGIQACYYDSNKKIVAKGETRISVPMTVSGLWIDDVYEGQATSIYGLISSSEALTGCKVIIENSAGQRIHTKNHPISGNQYEYRLEGSNIDYNTTINMLKADSYTLTVVVQNKGNESVEASTGFTVMKKPVVTQEDAGQKENVQEQTPKINYGDEYLAFGFSLLNYVPGWDTEVLDITVSAAANDYTVNQYLDKINDSPKPFNSICNNGSFPTETYLRDVVGDWQLVKYEYTDDAAESGFEAMAFKKGNRIFISYCGTETAQDIATDAVFALTDFMPGQLYAAVRFYKGIRAEYGSEYEIMLTGHSLGGALATYICALTGYKAITINGANGIVLNNIMLDIYGRKFDEYFNTFNFGYAYRIPTQDWNCVNYLTEVAPEIQMEGWSLKFYGMNILNNAFHAFRTNLLKGKAYTYNEENGVDAHNWFAFMEYNEEEKRFSLTARASGYNYPSKSSRETYNFTNEKGSKLHYASEFKDKEIAISGGDYVVVNNCSKNGKVTIRKNNIFCEIVTLPAEYLTDDFNSFVSLVNSKGISQNVVNAVSKQMLCYNSKKDFVESFLKYVLDTRMIVHDTKVSMEYRDTGSGNTVIYLPNVDFSKAEPEHSVKTVDVKMFGAVKETSDILSVRDASGTVDVYIKVIQGGNIRLVDKNGNSREFDLKHTEDRIDVDDMTERKPGRGTGGSGGGGH